MAKTSAAQTAMHRAALLAIAGTAGAAALRAFCRWDWLLTAAITLGTVSFHLAVRLIAGGVVSAVLRNRVDCRRAWFQPRPWEEALYRALRVKRWKGLMPTYQPALFSSRLHSPGELAQVMCQAELVHTLNIPLSFLPLLAARWFGAFPVFLITSAAAACFDAMFVMIQRYNRPRVLRLAVRREQAISSGNRFPPAAPPPAQ